MHILLTDSLRCPRCGPEHGLIVLADKLADRQILEGRLGCANCRQSFPVVEGVADLRWEGSEPVKWMDSSVDDERAVRTAALLGVTGPGKPVLVVERTGEIAAAVAGMVPDVHVLALIDGEAKPSGSDGGTVSHLRSGWPLPFQNRSLVGVAQIGVASEGGAAELLRVVDGGGRIVFDPYHGESVQDVRDAGARVLLEQEGIVVASPSEPG